VPSVIEKLKNRVGAGAADTAFVEAHGR
jgi:hypothetical protein